MVYPLIPLYLASVSGMAVAPAFVGIIEGIAESVASLLKVYSGYFSDKTQKKKLTAFIGYVPALLYKLVLLIASSWVWVLVARVLDRLGKGIRTAPRDVLVSESADKNTMGKAFGIHKALDMGGSALGILITYFLLKSMIDDFNFQKIFIISIIPAVIGLFLFVFVKESSGNRPDCHSVCRSSLRGRFLLCLRSNPHSVNSSSSLRKSWIKLNPQLKLYLLVVLIFTLGNSSKAFLLLRAIDVGYSQADVILLYFLFTFVASVFSLPFGSMSDKIGRKTLLVAGYFVFSLVYLGFATATGKVFLFAMFVLYGIYTAMITGVERAYIAEIAPKELKGTMLGLHSTVAGIALLPASVITGVLWTAFNPFTAFVFGAALSSIAAIILLVCMQKKPCITAVRV
jgi:MFS family permease